MGTLKRKRDQRVESPEGLPLSKRPRLSGQYDHNETIGDEALVSEDVYDWINRLTTSDLKITLRSLASKAPSLKQDVADAITKLVAEEKTVTVDFQQRYAAELADSFEADGTVPQQARRSKTSLEHATDLRLAMHGIHSGVKPYSNYETKSNALFTMLDVFHVNCASFEHYHECMWFVSGCRFFLEILKLCEDDELFRLIKDQSFPDRNFPDQLRQAIEIYSVECDDIATTLEEAVTVIKPLEDKIRENEAVSLVEDALAQLNTVSVDNRGNQNQIAMRRRVKEARETLARLDKLLNDEDDE